MKHDELEQQIDLGLRGLSRSGSGHGAAGAPLAADDGAPPAPDISAAWAAAHTRAAKLRRRNTMRNTTMLLLLAGLLTVAGLTLWPRGNGWAVTDGWIVEYEIEVPAYYGPGGSESPVDAPAELLSAAVSKWAAENRIEGRPTAAIEVAPKPFLPGNGFVRGATVKITLPSESDKLLAQLLEFVHAPGAGLPAATGEVRRYSKQWYFQEKYPQLFEQREIEINGKAYIFPRDFNRKPDIDALNMLCGFMPQPGKAARFYYYNLLAPETLAETGLGSIVRMDVAAEDMVVRLKTVRQADPFAPGELAKGHVNGLGSTFGQPGWTDEDFADALIQELRLTPLITPAMTERKLEVTQLKYLLFPLQRYQPGQPAATYQVSEEDKKQALAVWGRYNSALSAFLRSHPEFEPLIQSRLGQKAYGDQMAELSYEQLTAQVRGAAPPLPRSTFSVELYREASAEQVAALKEALDKVVPDAVSFQWTLAEPDWSRYR
ncbi:hypothetical protein IT575_13790 [bacterium]|nr:hypothetical protein [bacterium]